jgi:hypothetical protein
VLEAAMKLEEKPLLHLSFCPCGYPVLDDSIQIGTVYTVDSNSVRGGFSYTCGRCRRLFVNVVVVSAEQILHPERPFARLPLCLFERRGGL